MSQHALIFTASERRLAALSPDDFLWRPRTEPSSMHTNLGPRLDELGHVPALHLDLVHLATLVYLVDRTAERSRYGWERQLELTVPVSDASVWETVAEPLESLLRFLSGDDWRLSFKGRRLPRAGDRAEVIGEGPVVLFSGGADSLCGALVVADDLGRSPVLMSHWDTTTTGGIQAALTERLDDLWSADTPRIAARIGRRRQQVGSGADFGKEPTSRTRSLLFVALGLAAASVRDADLVMAENGWASMNVPLGGERRGALSTRTTHPAFLDGLMGALRTVGITTPLTNPFEALTKGEMFRRVKQIHGADVASELLSMTHSCAKPGAQYHGFSPAAQCGLCFGCLVRRGAFLAADLEDGTEYVELLLRGQGRRRARWLTDEKRKTYTALRYRVERGISPTDIVTLGLPARVSRADALRLARAGLAEAAQVTVP